MLALPARYRIRAATNLLGSRVLPILFQDHLLDRRISFCPSFNFLSSVLFCRNSNGEKYIRDVILLISNGFRSNIRHQVSGNHFAKDGRQDVLTNSKQSPD